MSEPKERVMICGEQFQSHHCDRERGHLGHHTDHRTNKCWSTHRLNDDPPEDITHLATILRPGRPPELPEVPEPAEPVMGQPLAPCLHGERGAPWKGALTATAVLVATTLGNCWIAARSEHPVRNILIFGLLTAAWPCVAVGLKIASTRR